MMLYYPYYYLFFRLHQFNEVVFNKNQIDDNWPLVGGVSSFQIINILSIIFIYESVQGVRILEVDNAFISGGAVIIVLLNALIFLWRDKDKKILLMFQDETKNHKTIGLFFTWIYIVGSYGFLFYALSLD